MVEQKDGRNSQGWLTGNDRQERKVGVLCKHDNVGGGRSGERDFGGDPSSYIVHDCSPRCLGANWNPFHHDPVACEARKRSASV